MPGYARWFHWAWLALPVIFSTAGCKSKAPPAELLFGRYLPEVRSQAAQAWKKFYGVDFRPAVRSQN
jgi:hypothetical protein